MLIFNYLEGLPELGISFSYRGPFLDKAGVTLMVKYSNHQGLILNPASICTIHAACPNGNRSTNLRGCMISGLEGCPNTQRQM